MTVFRFKRFQVQNDLSAMKINTDGVLLGAWCSVFPDDKNVLDIGTGTGVVALIVAQRLSEAKRGLPFCGSLSQDDSIIGIDIDDLSVQEAGLNFKNSPWKDNLRAEHCALGDFPSWKADLVVSNPPYFESETRSPSVRRKQARSTDTMSFREVLSYSQANLSDNGRVAMTMGSSGLVSSVPVKPAVPANLRRKFYVAMSVLLAIMIAIGFWPSYYGPLLRGAADAPLILHVHGVIYVGWMLLLIAQLSPGSTVQFRFLRDGRQIEIPIKIGKRPKPGQRRLGACTSRRECRRPCPPCRSTQLAYCRAWSR